MRYKVTFTTVIDDQSVGPAHAIEQARLAVVNYGSGGWPNVETRVNYTREMDEGWSLRFNPDRLDKER